LKKDPKKGWVISRAPVPANKQSLFFQDLISELVKERFNQLQNPEALIIRINIKFQKISSPTKVPTTILFKSSSKEFSFLSNFFSTLIVYNGRLFRSSEHLYQWSVVVMLNPDIEDEAFNQISTIIDPLKAKNYAHQVKKTLHQDITPQQKLEIMNKVTRLKYSQNTQLREALIATGQTELREDTESAFWGGTENHMGKILMNTRSIFLQNLIAEVN
jgi:ribA/ribD-fused uncharacterized protein